jgi:anhydro-N-acetylmuramic acid kinase
MNKNIKQLYSISQKEERIIIGLMSGTSLDGLDIALCKIKGAGKETKVEVLQFETVHYTNDFKEEVRTIFSKKQVDLEKLCLLDEWIGTKHGEMINDCLQKWNIDNSTVDIIASHGQTIYHAPKRLHQLDKFGNGTLQIGDGDHLAVATGIITISDFRQKHIAIGGEGAPLAIYGDYILFSNPNENRVMLNIGGIANFTYLPASGNTKEVICTDIGPGNTLMDAYARKYFIDKSYDEGANIARQGKVNEALLNTLKADDFFSQPFPKSTGPELFNLEYIEKAKNLAGIDSISHYDIMATLNKFTADMIVDAFKKAINPDESFVVNASGGGIHNPLIMEHLQSQLPNILFKDFTDLGINPDAKEAVLFAVLANEALCGNNSFDGNLSGMPPISMGKISFPN